MQELGIQAGRTEEEVAAAQEWHREELREDITRSANIFFWAAGFAAITSGLLPVRIGILIDLGIIDLLYVYGRQFGSDQGLVIGFVSVALISLLVALGAMGRLQKRWAFFVGMILYGADIIALMLTFSVWAVGVHGFFLLRWYQGQRAVAELRQAK